MNELPNGWAWSTVGEVGAVQLGRQRSPKWHTGDHMRPYLRVANVFEDRIDLTSVMEMDFPPDQYQRFKLEHGDILLNEGQSPEWVGRPAMYRGELPGACFTNSLIRFRPYTGIDKDYALLVFRHHLHSRRFMREARITTNIAHLSSTRFAAIEFPVPPLSEQRRIVAAIEEQFSRLDAAEAQLKDARRRGAVLNRSLLSQANRSEWPVVALGELLAGIQAGKSFQTPGRPAASDEWGVIKVSAMTWGSFDESENKAVLDTERIDERYQIEPGDLLLSRANTSALVGAAVLVDQCRDRLLLSDKSMRLLTAPGVDRRWLRYCLGSPAVRAQMSAVASGTSDSMRNISQEKVRALRIHAPDSATQARVASEIEEQLALADRLASQLRAVGRRTAALRRSMLAAAFSGELVDQDPSDEPASVLLKRIAAERRAKSPRRRVATSSRTTHRHRVAAQE